MNPLSGLWAAFSPTHCVHCGATGVDKLELCFRCQDELEQCRIPDCELPGKTEAGRSVWGTWYYRHDSPIRTLHRLLKFKGRDRLGRDLGLRMVGHLPAAAFLQGHEACIALPSHRARVLERGYLHTQPIASSIAVNRGIPVVPGVLVRSDLTGSQSSLGKSERLKNIQNAFKMVVNTPLRSVILVDDVMTTGVTLDAAAEILERHGMEVTLIVAAFRREAF